MAIPPAPTDSHLTSPTDNLYLSGIPSEKARSRLPAHSLAFTLMAKTKSKSSSSSRSSSSSSKRGSGKRTLIKPKGDARFVRRDARGRIRESDDMGRSLKQDRSRKAKRKVASGYGDRGDR
jgi:hypothetical protein